MRKETHYFYFNNMETQLPICFRNKNRVWGNIFQGGDLPEWHMVYLLQTPERPCGMGSRALRFPVSHLDNHRVHEGMDWLRSRSDLTVDSNSRQFRSFPSVYFPLVFMNISRIIYLVLRR